jgi:hypothetical protein
VEVARASGRLRSFTNCKDYQQSRGDKAGAHFTRSHTSVWMLSLPLTGLMIGGVLMTS